jgi:hypothetical protein
VILTRREAIDCPFAILLELDAKDAAPLTWAGVQRDVLVAHGDWEGGSLFALKLNATGMEQ